MERTKVANTVTAAAVIAVAGGLTLAGCRALTPRRPAAADGGEEAALASAAATANSAAASGVAAVKVHTAIAQELVEQALPHSSPVGQAQLSAAGMEHQAVLHCADQTAASLEELKAQFAQASQALAEARSEVAAIEAQQRKLQREWYVVWGLRAEKAFWTLATTWLIASGIGLLLGTGTPLSWIAKLRGLFVAKSASGWIGEAFVK